MKSIYASVILAGLVISLVVGLYAFRALLLTAPSAAPPAATPNSPTVTSQSAGPTSTPTAVKWTRFQEVKHGFSVQYPSDWTSGIGGEVHDRGERALNVEHPRNRQGIEPGGPVYPRLSVSIFRSAAPDPSMYFQVPAEEISVTREQTVLSGRPATLSRFRFSAPEMAITVSNVLEVKTASRAYLLDFSYGLAGCSGLPSELRPECVAENEKLVKDSEEIFNRMIATFDVQ